MSDKKAPYICGPLTDLPVDLRESVRAFYVRLGDLCAEVLGIRAFVPHEHYDPIKMANVDKTVVCAAERKIVTQETSLVIACVIAPSWGSGKELGWAEDFEVPTVLLVPKSLERLSRLVNGGSNIVAEIPYEDEEHAILELKAWLLEFDEAQKAREKIKQDMHELDLKSEDPEEHARWQAKIGAHGIPTGRIPSR